MPYNDNTLKNASTLGIDWVAIKADYMTGMSPNQIIKKYGVTQGALSQKIATDMWVAKRDALQKERYQGFINRIVNKLDTGLESILNIVESPNSKDSDKIAAFKLITDLLGVKKQQIEISGGLDNTNEHTINVIINRQPIKKISSNEEIVIDAIVNNNDEE